MRRLKASEVVVVRAAILAKRQEGKCAICSTPLTVANGCLDHDHATGIVRGVLCRNCNGMEGKIKTAVTRGKRGMSANDYLGAMLLYWMHHATDRTGLLYPTHLTLEEKRVKINTRARKKRAAIKKAGS